MEEAPVVESRPRTPQEERYWAFRDSLNIQPKKGVEFSWETIGTGASATTNPESRKRRWGPMNRTDSVAHHRID